MTMKMMSRQDAHCEKEKEIKKIPPWKKKKCPTGGPHSRKNNGEAATETPVVGLFLHRSFKEKPIRKEHGPL